MLEISQKTLADLNIPLPGKTSNETSIREKALLTMQEALRSLEAAGVRLTNYAMRTLCLMLLIALTTGCGASFGQSGSQGGLRGEAHLVGQAQPVSQESGVSREDNLQVNNTYAYVVQTGINGSNCNVITVALTVLNQNGNLAVQDYYRPENTFPLSLANSLEITSQCETDPAHTELQVGTISERPDGSIVFDYTDKVDRWEHDIPPAH